MNNLFLRSKEIVQANVSKEVDAQLVELISLAMSALMLLKPIKTIEKMPSILKDLDIIADNRSVLDIAHEELEDYMEDEMLKNSSSAVIREIVVDDDIGEILEKRHLVVSLKKFDYTEIFCKLIHEFVHMLRFFDVSFDDNKIVSHSGFVTAEYDCDTGTMRRDNYYFEEGVVQFFTNEAIDLFIDYVKCNEKEAGDCLSKLDMKKINACKKGYILQTSLVSEAANDDQFRILLDDSFNSFENCTSLIKYFNQKLESETAFDYFSKILENTYISLIKNNGSYVNVSGLQQLRVLIEMFLSKNKKRS